METPTAKDKVIKIISIFVYMLYYHVIKIDHFLDVFEMEHEHLVSFIS